MSKFLGEDSKSLGLERPHRNVATDSFAPHACGLCAGEWEAFGWSVGCLMLTDRDAKSAWKESMWQIIDESRVWKPWRQSKRLATHVVVLAPRAKSGEVGHWLWVKTQVVVFKGVSLAVHYVLGLWLKLISTKGPIAARWSRKDILTQVLVSVKIWKWCSLAGMKWKSMTGAADLADLLDGKPSSSSWLSKTPVTTRVHPMGFAGPRSPPNRCIWQETKIKWPHCI